MATLMGPTYANLFAGFIEHQFFSQYNGPKPEYCGTFTRDERTQLITVINSSRLALKYTWEISDTCLAFLDIKISIEGDNLCTSVSHKLTDSHSYLLHAFSHPLHAKNFILFAVTQTFV